MASEQFSLRLSKDIKARLEELANATGRTKAFLAQDAIEKYLEIESWQIKAIRQGMQEVENNDTVSISDIKAEWKLD